MSRSAIRSYEEFVVREGLERVGLFEVLAGRIGAQAKVLYPGCFVHLTPAFFFRRVVFVDRNPAAAEFFADSSGIGALLGNGKRYPGASAHEFIHSDFTHSLPLSERSFDLLLALYAGGISRSCQRYLRPGGYLVTNNHDGDAIDASHDPELELSAVVTERRGTFELRETGVDAFSSPEEHLAAVRTSRSRHARKPVPHAWLYRRR